MLLIIWFSPLCALKCIINNMHWRHFSEQTLYATCFTHTACILKCLFHIIFPISICWQNFDVNDFLSLCSLIRLFKLPLWQSTFLSSCFLIHFVDLWLLTYMLLLAFIQTALQTKYFLIYVAHTLAYVSKYS